MFSDFNQDGIVGLGEDDPVTPLNELEITQESHYYPFGMNHLGPWYETVAPENKYLYNGKELNGDYEINLMDYGARWYDGAIGRWTAVDPLAEDAMQVDKSPYAYGWNNPVRLSDPDGRCPWCIGAIVGAAIDYGTQVAVNYATGNENPWTDVDTKSILVSAGAGASGVGLVTKAGKVFNGRTLKAAEMAIDGSVNAAQQYLNKGEVDLKETAVAIGLGQAVRSPVRDKVKANAEPKLKQLDKQASTAQRYARNAEVKGSRPGKVQRLQNEATTATKKAESSRVRTNMKAAASGASGSSGAGRVINNAQYQKEDNEK